MRHGETAGVAAVAAGIRDVQLDVVEVVDVWVHVAGAVLRGADCSPAHDHR